jgi:hypothetical protein
MKRATSRLILAAAIVCSTAIVSRAQTTTSSSETKSFSVLAVDGNSLVVSLPEGMKELTVPDDFRFTVNGKQMSVHELKVGMKGTATITTRTTVTPVTVTEVKQGKVIRASGASVTVQMADGFKEFTQGDVDKRGAKIMVRGKPVQIQDLHSGQVLTATIITQQPPHVLTQQEVQATLATAAAAPAAGAAPAGARASSTAGGSGSSSTAAAPAGQSASAGGGGARTLPKTASSWPLLGLASMLFLAVGLALNVRRRFVR